MPRKKSVSVVVVIAIVELLNVHGLMHATFRVLQRVRGEIRYLEERRVSQETDRLETAIQSLLVSLRTPIQAA